MRTRLLIATAILCMLATVVYAQAGLAGKWETDPPAAGAGGGRGGGGQTRLDLKIDGGKVTGTMFEGGADLEVKEGTATAKQAKWYTIRKIGEADFRVNWTADMTDDNTVSLSREFPNGLPAGFGGGGGRGGGRGAGGGGGGGAAAGGAPPAAGAAAPAAPAAPAPPAAGAPPAGGGAPGGGGGGGGRGGRGGGGGTPGPVTLHRAK